MKKIGICGCGFVGNAIYTFFLNKETENKIEKEKEKDYQIFVYDKYKKVNNKEDTVDILFITDILFICLPTNLDPLTNTYNMDEIDNTLLLLNNHNYNGIIIIKSTVLPDYCSKMNDIYPRLKIIHNPEFLSAITAIKDFANQSHIILGYTKYSKSSIEIIKNMYMNLFPNAIISVSTSEESSLVKLGCNSFYATKIQYFTELYLLCQKMNISFDNVKNMMLQNNWINPMHTIIPGPDGKISYGGACFPKDIEALSNYMKDQYVSNIVLDAVIKENKEIRK